MLSSPNDIYPPEGYTSENNDPSVKNDPSSHSHDSQRSYSNFPGLEFYEFPRVFTECHNTVIR